ncbi:hypothetical protein [Mycoplasma sp. 21DD0573]|uniref:ABC transporter permease n=1 Tax=unclassified Mycoplasma TaxID=2683645 RepID=UPI002B1DC45C|nr:hypothetical protein [Mycoplasma sp. 21DD0573]MEA4276447.1 hypothetical protein [Mycoplasma sp. 21DD0573]
MFTLTANKIKENLMLEDKKSSRRKLYSSLWAVLIGLLFASVIYWLKGIADGTETTIFTFVQNIFEFAFSEYILNDTLLLFIFFALASFSVAIGFKSGLFNIGVSGQMLLPGVLFFAILAGTRVDLKNLSLSFLLGMMFISVIIGAMVGAIPGILKAYFNVHEVISTIFLNWIVTFLGIWLFTFSNDVFIPQSDPNYINWIGLEPGTTAKLVFTNLSRDLGIDVQRLFIYIGITLVCVIAVAIWFVYSKTTLGYKIKMVGLNKTNSKYVGINEKAVTVCVMAIAGALAGLGGFFYIVVYTRQVAIKPQAPLAIGFESIAIALVALNNPFGVLATGFLCGMIRSGQASFSVTEIGPKVSKDFFPIITGIIIFMSALSIMFYKFRPMRYVWKQIILMCHREYWENFSIYHNLRSRSHIKKSWNKARALYAENLISSDPDMTKEEIDEKCKSYYSEWLLQYQQMVKETKAQIAELSVKLKEYKKTQKQKLQDTLSSFTFAKFYEKQIDKFYEYWSINEHVKELDETSKAYLWALYLAKEKANADWRLYAKNEYDGQLRVNKLKISEETANEVKKLEFEILELKSKIYNTSIKDEIKILRRYSKEKLQVFARYEKAYEARVANLILTLKGQSVESKMTIYDEISKEKFALQKARTDLGVDEYQSYVQKSKALKRSRKLVYREIREKIYNDFVNKYIIKPWDNRVLRIQESKSMEGAK